MIYAIRMLAFAAVLTSMTALLGACGSDDTANGGGGSCTKVDSGLTACYEYPGSSYHSNGASIEGSCAQDGGTYSASACDTSGQVGSCVVGGGTVGEVVVHYGSGYDSNSATNECSTVFGTYTAG